MSIELHPRLDDPFDAVAVHGGAGVVGVLCAPIFSHESGVFWNKDGWETLGKLKYLLSIRSLN